MSAEIYNQVVSENLAHKSTADSNESLADQKDMNLQSELDHQLAKDLESKISSDSETDSPKKVYSAIRAARSPKDLYFESNTDVMGISAAFFCATACCYFLNQEFAQGFVKVSYPILDSPGYYTNGPLDLLLAIQFISLILFIRAAAINYVFYPLSTWMGINNFKLNVRFCEQSWQFVYGFTSFFCGCYILLSNPEFVGFDVFWRTYPIIKLSLDVKLYYIVQLGFWSSQMVTLFIEERRRDFGIMLAHHLVTISLVLYGYYIHAIYIGILVHANMDAVDIFLPLSKMFKYAGFDKCVNFSFLAMLVTWLYTRHYLLCRIIYNTFVESPLQTEMLYDPSQGKYWTDNARLLATAFLSALEILCCIWLYQIFLVIKNIFKGKGTTDIRSDDEEESKSTTAAHTKTD
ncbi:Sphingosine N-acyltransferase lag1 [Smittium culicis]|uniref:Sphingosine N-acyltransferase lag1 n=1 Tax=Smittium culicis TaxID=133412 RepID=A0A1R1XGT8_9FUNG|nr:Sphingosine N-acyltransferase lag1 [Smittium culicis]